MNVLRLVAKLKPYFKLKKIKLQNLLVCKSEYYQVMSAGKLLLLSYTTGNLAPIVN